MREVVIPALVAAIVTLGIEFFAKPSLEARKERITERFRGQREARRHFRALAFELGRVLVYLDSESADVPPDFRGARLRVMRGSMRSHLDSMVTELAPGLESRDSFVEDALLEFAALCEVYLMSASEDEAASLDIAGELLNPLADLVSEAIRAPAWRQRKRRRIQAAIDALPGSGAAKTSP